MGSNEQAEDALSLRYKNSLLEVCNYDFDIAFEKYQSLLVAMESYSDQIGFDLKGVKMWCNFYFEKDGTIKHITFHLKPQSRNIKTDELTAFLSSFMNKYKFPVITAARFYHTGVINFPVNPKPTSN
jgi:hypothetical protein